MNHTLLLVINEDKVAPGTLRHLDILGINYILTEGPETPAVQKVPTNDDLRSTTAVAVLQGMIASAPMVDRTKVNKNAWAKVAVEFADALLVELAKDGVP